MISEVCSLLCSVRARGCTLSEPGRQNRLKQVLAISCLLSFLAFPISSSACSSVACVGDGFEARKDFTVRITHGGRPLAGVKVEVTGYLEHDSGTLFSGVTASDGTTQISGLPSGDFWIRAELLGIDAGTACFHVNDRPTGKAKRSVEYRWGNSAPATLEIAGTLVDTQLGQGETRLLNFIHKVDVPVVGATLKLQNARTGMIFSSVSERDGSFSFRSIPNGVYVLHAAGGKAGTHEYDSSNTLIERSDRAASKRLLLRRTQPGGGDCGGTTMELRSPSNE